MRARVGESVGLEVLWQGSAPPAGLDLFLAGQVLDDLAAWPASPAPALEVLRACRGRFLLPLGPAHLGLLAAARRSLLASALRALEAWPEAELLVVPGDLATVEAQAGSPRLCRWPPGRALAPEDLAFARAAAFRALRLRELPAGASLPELLGRFCAEGRALLLAQDLFGRLVREPPAGAAPLPPAERLAAAPQGLARRAWKAARRAAVRRVGEEQVEAVLRPLKGALASASARLAAGDERRLDRADPPALDAARRRLLEARERRPVRHLRRQALPPGRVRVALMTPWLVTGGVERALVDMAACLPRDRYELVAVTTRPARHEWEWRLSPHVDDVVHLGGVLPPERIPGAALELLRSLGARGLFCVNSWDGYATATLARTALPGLRTMDYQHSDSQLEGGDFARVSCARYAGALDVRVVLDEFLRERYRAYGVDPARVRVIRAGCDEEGAFHPSRVPPGQLRARLGVAAGVPLVGFVGRLVPEKDPLFVLSVWEELARRVADARFALVGEGPLLPEVRAAAGRGALAGRVHLLPAATEIAPALRDLTLLLLASRVEGLPLVLIEAAALGTPVVSTALEGIPELVGPETGACVPDAPDPAERRRLLVEAAMPLLLDPALRERKGRAARARVEAEFSSARRQAQWRAAFADWLVEPSPATC